MKSVPEFPFSPNGVVAIWRGQRRPRQLSIRPADRSVTVSRMANQPATETGPSWGCWAVTELHREVHLPPPIVDVVAERAHERGGDEPLFASPKGAWIHATNWRREIHWKDSAKAFGVEFLRPHDFRHTCATLCLKWEVNPKIVQRILGHADVQTTLKIYSHVSDSDVHEAARISALWPRYWAKRTVATASMQRFSSNF